MRRIDDHAEDSDPALETAYDALRGGDPESALTSAARITDAGERALVEVRCYLDLQMLEAASGGLDRAREELGSDDIDVVELEGEIALDRWELDDASEAFEAIAEVQQDAWIWERRALLADHAGDHELAQRLLVEAAAMDPERSTPIEVSDTEFDAAVESALRTLAPDVARHLEDVRIVREPIPFRELVDPSDVSATPPDILGLFVGPTIHDLSEGASAELPPTIFLFKHNLERMARSEEQLAEEIRVTLFHEIGHLLGLDEDGVASLGLA
jgi:predicted Zn-dependent protease with MMP-like domain